FFEFLFSKCDISNNIFSPSFLLFESLFFDSWEGYEIPISLEILFLFFLVLFFCLLLFLICLCCFSYIFLCVVFFLCCFVFFIFFFYFIIFSYFINISFPYTINFLFFSF